MRTRDGLWLFGLAFTGACLLIDPLDDVALQGGTGGTGGATGTGATGATGGSGGATGGGGGSGGSGGSIPCDDPTQDACAAVTPRPVAGDVQVTDMAFVPPSSVVVVGTFTGTASFGGAQLQAGPNRSGFVVEYVAEGAVTAQTVLPEPIEGESLFVDYNPVANVIAVGGAYTAGGDCPGEKGLFLRGLQVQGTDFVDAFTAQSVACAEAEASAVLAPEDILVTNDGYVLIVGSASGTIAGNTTDGADGFIFETLPDGSVAADGFWLLGGAGDAAIRSIMVHDDVSGPLSVIVGDYTGDMRFLIPSFDESFTTPPDTRRLFVASIDRFDQSPNLDVSVFGEAGSDHRAIDVARSPAMAGEHYLLASIEGSLQVGLEDISVPGGGRGGLLLSFRAADAIQAPIEPLEYRAHHVITAAGLEMKRMGTSGNRVTLGGLAAGPIEVAKNGSLIETIPSAGCLRNAFFLHIEPAIDSYSTQRCGDGSQRLDALTGFGTAAYAASLTVPTGGTIELDNGAGEPETSDQTYLFESNDGQ